MTDVAASRRLTGRDHPHPAPLPLRAGPVTALLDVDAADTAGIDPAAFRATGTDASVVDGRLVLELGPYAIARIDPA